MRSFPSQHHSKFYINTATENVSQVCIYKGKARSFVCKIKLNLLRSSRYFNCDTAFTAIVSFLNEIVHGFNNICNGEVETRLHIVKSRRIWKFFNKNQNLSLCDILVPWWMRYFQKCMEFLSGDVFLCFTDFLWGDLLYICRWTW